MSPSYLLKSRRLQRFPRMRGDEPKARFPAFAVDEFSPHARG